MNNLVEGFSGVGGVGINISDTDMRVISYGANSVYDCTTESSGTPPIVKTWVADESLSASPFTDAANDDFSPVDTGSVKEGSEPGSFYQG